MRLNRPDALNALTADMAQELVEVLERAVGDPTVRVLVLSGAGRAFCAGGDLRQGVGGGVAGGPPVGAQERRLRTLMRSAQLLHDAPVITIAAVNGACAGAGLSLALATDLRICSPTARFSTAFLAVGLSGDFGGTWLLPRVIGPARARELYLRPGPFGAEHALAIGLVSEVADEVGSRASDLAAELIGRPPVALRAIKQNLNDAEHLSFAELLDLEAARHTACSATEDAAEATAAFLHRRPPTFVGR